MTINIEATVKAIALTVPSATRIFEELGIDYCCGGNLSLAAACDKAKVSVAKVVEALEHPARSAKWEGNERYWQSARLGQLIDHIVNTHHAFTRSELARIERTIIPVNFPIIDCLEANVRVGWRCCENHKDVSIGSNNCHTRGLQTFWKQVLR